MGKCKGCGKRGIFLKLTPDQYCSACDAKRKEQKQTVDALRNTTLTISHEFSVRNVDIGQKTSGAIKPFSVSAWSGYVSPSGGFVNYARYQVVGINPKTKRKNKRIYEECDEKYAKKRAEIEGLVGPFDIQILPSLPPTDNQLSYARSLGITIPKDACWRDINALITRVTDDDENPVDEHLAAQAHIYGVKFSRYSGRKEIMRLAIKLPREDYREFLSSI